MNRRLLLPSLLLSASLLLASFHFAPGLAADAEPSGSITQAAFAVRLLAALGWESGLPEKPQTADYLAILTGTRSYRFEAEEVYNAETDGVSLRNYPLYGAFTGSGWLSGTAMPTEVHFRVMIRREGDYLLKVVSRGDGQRWRAGGTELVVNAGGSLREIEAGLLRLKPGYQEITLRLPPEGGVDSFTLTAQQVPSVSPLGGWRADAVLTWGDLAETVAAVRGLDRLLPEDPAHSPKPVSVEAAAKLPFSMYTTSAGYLGPFTPPRWVRVSSRPATVIVPLQVPETGVYDLRGRLLGASLAVELDGTRIERQGRPYLDWVDFGTFRLQQGSHSLMLKLPVNGGADVIALVRRTATPAEYLKVTGLKGNPQGPVPAAELDMVLKDALNRPPDKR